MANDVTKLVADRLTRAPDESDSHWQERVRRFMDGGVFCKTCGADLAQQAAAAGTSLDPLACYCGPECDSGEERSCYYCREARYRCPHGFHYDLRDGYEPSLLGFCVDLPARTILRDAHCPECDPAEQSASGATGIRCSTYAALADAEAGLGSWETAGRMLEEDQGVVRCPDCHAPCRMVDQGTGDAQPRAITQATSGLMCARCLSPAGRFLRIGWAVEAEASPGVWGLRSLPHQGGYVWDGLDAIAERDALLTDGIPARISPVLVAPPVGD